MAGNNPEMVGNAYAYICELSFVRSLSDSVHVANSVRSVLSERGPNGPPSGPGEETCIRSAHQG